MIRLIREWRWIPGDLASHLRIPSHMDVPAILCVDCLRLRWKYRRQPLPWFPYRLGWRIIFSPRAHG